MFNYNLINPVNIHYRKYSGNAVSGEEEKKQSYVGEENQGGKRFPNGNKVAIDYTKNQVNISQILQDFKSTIAAINTPDDIKKEVESYLSFTGAEASKDEPSREIIFSNLKNAARITDRYIQESLKKPSRVVEDWVNALFMQQVNLKADPAEINEEFKVNIPEKKSEPFVPYTENYTAPKESSLLPLKEDTVEIGAAPVQPEYKINDAYIEAAPVINTPVFEAPKTAETDIPAEFIPENPADPYAPKTENEALAKDVLLRAKAEYKENSKVYDTLKLYDEALELMEGSSNQNLKSAIYFERGKILNSCDYAELALIDFNKAAKCTDNNLKAQAHIKMGNIYDDYVQFDPAMDQYSRAIEASEAANNPGGKTRALRYIAGMFTKRYDIENTETFSELAMETARETESPSAISKTYLEAAENYKYIGETSKALHVYGQLAQEKAVQDDYETLAKNYIEASALMEKKGNKAKAYALMLKGKEYQRMARLQSKENIEAA